MSGNLFGAWNQRSVVIFIIPLSVTLESGIVTDYSLARLYLLFFYCAS